MTLSGLCIKAMHPPGLFGEEQDAGWLHVGESGSAEKHPWALGEPGAASGFPSHRGELPPFFKVMGSGVPRESGVLERLGF